MEKRNETRNACKPFRSVLARLCHSLCASRRRRWGRLIGRHGWRQQRGRRDRNGLEHRHRVQPWRDLRHGRPLRHRRPGGRDHNTRVKRRYRFIGRINRTERERTRPHPCRQRNDGDVPAQLPAGQHERQLQQRGSRRSRHTPRIEHNPLRPGHGPQHTALSRAAESRAIAGPDPPVLGSRPRRQIRLPLFWKPH